MDELARHPHEVIPEFLDVWGIFGVAIVEEVADPSLLVGKVDLIASHLQHFGQEIDLDQVDEDDVTGVEDELESEDGVELEVYLYFVVVEETVQFFQGPDDPHPTSMTLYIFCSLNFAMKGCSLFLTLLVTSKASRNCSSAKPFFIFFQL